MSFDSFLCNCSHHIAHSKPFDLMHFLTLLCLVLLQHLLHDFLLLDQKCPYDPILDTVRTPRSSICALYGFLGLGDFGVFAGAKSGDLETKQRVSRFDCVELSEESGIP